MAFDPIRDAVWTTNETARLRNGDRRRRRRRPRDRAAGGEAGNVAYDSFTDQMLVAVQGRGDLAVIDPAALTVSGRVAPRMRSPARPGARSRRPSEFVGL